MSEAPGALDALEALAAVRAATRERAEATLRDALAEESAASHALDLAREAAAALAEEGKARVAVELARARTGAALAAVDAMGRAHRAAVVEQAARVDRAAEAAALAADAVGVARVALGEARANERAVQTRLADAVRRAATLAEGQRADEVDELFATRSARSRRNLDVGEPGV